MGNISSTFYVNASTKEIFKVIHSLKITRDKPESGSWTDHRIITKAAHGVIENWKKNKMNRTKKKRKKLKLLKPNQSSLQINVSSLNSF